MSTIKEMASPRSGYPFDEANSQEQPQDIPLLQIRTVESQDSTADPSVKVHTNPFLAPEDYFSRPDSSTSTPVSPATQSATSPGASIISEFISTQWSGSLKPSIELSSLTTETSKRHSQLRGVDASARSAEQQTNASSNIFVAKDGPVEDPTSFKLGLEEALGKDSNWLTKKPDSLVLPEINRDKISLDFDRPLSQITQTTTPTRSNDPIRDAEEGLIVQRTSMSRRSSRSPVKNISKAVKTISTRILGQKGEGEEPDQSTHKPEPVQLFDTSYLSPLQDVSLKSPEKPTNEKHLSPYRTDSSSYDRSIYGYNSRQEEEDVSSNFSIFNDSTENLTSTVSVSPSLALPPPPPPLKLIGKSLKIFDSDNKFRLFLYHQLHKAWMEPFMFFLIIFQTLVLTFANVKNIFDGIDEEDQTNYEVIVPGRYKGWAQWCQLAIFICYTILAVAKIIAYGFWDDSQRKKLVEKEKPDITPQQGAAFSLNSREGLRRRNFSKNVPLVPTFVNLIPSKHRAGLQNQGDSLDSNTEYRVAPERAFLRGSWNRLQFIAIISYWISLLLMINDADLKSEIFVFHMLSGLPILHLLNLTSGTSSVLQSLKTAAPLLVNVGIFVGFFW